MLMGQAYRQKPDVSPGSEAEQQEILQVISRDKPKAPLHRIHSIAYCILVVRSAADMSSISADGKDGKWSPFHRIIQSGKDI